MKRYGRACPWKGLKCGETGANATFSWTCRMLVGYGFPEQRTRLPIKAFSDCSNSESPSADEMRSGGRGDWWALEYSHKHTKALKVGQVGISSALIWTFTWDNTVGPRIKRNAAISKNIRNLENLEISFLFPLALNFLNLNMFRILILGSTVII